MLNVIKKDVIKAPGSNCIKVKFAFLGFLCQMPANYHVEHLFFCQKMVKFNRFLGFFLSWVSLIKFLTSQHQLTSQSPLEVLREISFFHFSFRNKNLWGLVPHLNICTNELNFSGSLYFYIKMKWFNLIQGLILSQDYHSPILYIGYSQNNIVEKYFFNDC